jgi:hypothetical protein
MARIIGRKGCTWCGFESAHVKQTEGKHPYHHCPGCGMQTIAKNGHQAALILANVRPEPDYTNPPGPPVPPVAADPIVVPGVVVKAGVKQEAKPPKAAVEVAPPPKGGGLWGQLMGANQ